MDIRHEFPTEVLDEAQYLLDNADMIPDPDGILLYIICCVDLYYRFFLIATLVSFD